MKTQTKPTTTTAAAPATPAPEVPDWVNDTPHQETYELEMYQEGGTVESIEMTRDEYISLKQNLARMRGYVVGEHTEGATRTHGRRPY